MIEIHLFIHSLTGKCLLSVYQEPSNILSSEMGKLAKSVSCGPTALAPPGKILEMQKNKETIPFTTAITKTKIT